MDEHESTGSQISSFAPATLHMVCNIVICFGDCGQGGFAVDLARSKP